VRRYGQGGSFWRENPELPYLPVEAWELWNEPNIVTFSSNSDPERFARLLRIGGGAIHGADPAAKVILGGLFGRPLQIPPNISSGDFLNRVYRARAGEAVLRRRGAASIRRRRRRDAPPDPQPASCDAGPPRRPHPLYVTELGWGSDSFQTRWERGPLGQARELDEAFSMLAGNRRAWRIGGVWWFSWTDIRGGCQFCDSAGLLTENREAKPAWYRFNRLDRGRSGHRPAGRFRRVAPALRRRPDARRRSGRRRRRRGFG
jgi:hypothetical protein